MPSHSSAFARAALGLMLVLAVAPVASAAPSRHESVPRGTIAVASSQDFRTMFLMNASDGRVTRIRAPDRVPTQRIDLSPSGNTIALAGLTGIWLVERSGRDAKQVLDFESATFAPDWVSWSPDGRSLAFTRAETLYVVRIADKRVRRILRGGVYAPDWSPDGSRLVFVRNADRRTGGGSVQSVDLNGRNLETIASGGHPDVSPDGSKVVFATREGIRVIPISGGRSSLVARRAEHPEWSPDGRHLAFTRETGCGHAGCVGRVFVMPAGGGRPRAMGPSIFEIGPLAWSR